MSRNVQKKRFSLVRLIVDDLLGNHKISLFFLVMIVISALAVLFITQETRKELFVREQLLLERDVIESEWRNLIIEENVLADSKRIEQKANSIGMQYVTPKNETVIVIKTH